MFIDLLSSAHCLQNVSLPEAKQLKANSSRFKLQITIRNISTSVCQMIPANIPRIDDVFKVCGYLGHAVEELAFLKWTNTEFNVVFVMQEA